MTPDNLIGRALTLWPYLAVAGVALVAALLVLAWLLRRKGRPKLARRITAAATLLGLGWSAQGMWDTAVHHYHQDVAVASVLFVVFEAMLTARMLKAHEHRANFRQRAKHVRSVWVIASVMAAVVALGEGWQQAPARLAIPLLVAYGWYVDLTADDDPDEKPKTSFRWTPRRLGLWIGMLEPGAKDAQTIDRDRLRARLTTLAFRIKYSPDWLNDFLHRPTRLARAKTLADDDDLRAVRARLARMSVDLMVAPERPRESAPSAPRPVRIQPGKQGVHSRAGQTYRGQGLRADALTQMWASVSDERPRGMATAALAALYDPPLKTRTAEAFAAEARREIPRPVNGFPILTE